MQDRYITFCIKAVQPGTSAGIKRNTVKLSLKTKRLCQILRPDFPHNLLTLPDIQKSCHHSA